MTEPILAPPIKPDLPSLIPLDLEENLDTQPKLTLPTFGTGPSTPAQTAAPKAKVPPTEETVCAKMEEQCSLRASIKKSGEQGNSYIGCPDDSTVTKTQTFKSFFKIATGIDGLNLYGTMCDIAKELNKLD